MKRLFFTGVLILFFAMQNKSYAQKTCYAIYKSIIKDATQKKYKIAYDKVKRLQVCLKDFPEKNKHLIEPTKKLDSLIVSSLDNAYKEQISQTEIAKVAREEAERQTIRANIEAQNALKEANRSKAFLWASEADKIVPMQGVKLILEAKKKDSKVSFVNEQLEKLVNGSSTHEFRERKRFSGAKYAYFLGDNKWLIFVLSDTNSQIWDLVNGTLKYTLKTSKQIFQPQVSPDGKWMINGSSDIQVFNLHNGQELAFGMSPKNIQRAYFANGGKWLITEDSTRAYQVWNLTNNQPKLLITGQEPIKNVSFSEDHKWLITFGRGVSKVWDLNTGKPAAFLETQQPILNAHFMSYDKKWLLIHGRTKVIKCGI